MGRERFVASSLSADLEHDGAEHAVDRTIGDAVLRAARRCDGCSATLEGPCQSIRIFSDPQFSRYERVVTERPGVYQIEPLGGDYYVPYYNPRIFFVGRHVPVSTQDLVLVQPLVSVASSTLGVGEVDLDSAGATIRSWLGGTRGTVVGLTGKDLTARCPFRGETRPESHSYAPQRGAQPQRRDEPHRDEHRDRDHR